MLIFVASYAFWVALSIGVGDQLSPPLGEQIYIDSVCTAKCLSDPSGFLKGQATAFNHTGFPEETTLGDCYTLCHSTKSKSSEMPLRIEENLKSTLLCRDDRSLTFRVVAEVRGDNRQPNNTRDDSRQPNDTRGDIQQPNDKDVAARPMPQVYIIILYEEDMHHVYMSDDEYFTLEELKPQQLYTISVVGVHASDEFSVIAPREQYSTLPRDYVPGKVSRLQVTDYRLDESNGNTLNAQLKWQPAGDWTCYYDVLCYEDSIHGNDFRPITIREPKQLYNYQLKNLKFSTRYNVGVRSINSADSLLESKMLWQFFETPSCVELYNYNFSICAPEKPEDLSVNKTLLKRNIYALDIRWKAPKQAPDYYTVRIIDLHYNSGGFMEFNATGEASSLFVPSIRLLSDMQEVILVAFGEGGNSTASVPLYQNVTENESFADELSTPPVLTYLFCLVIIIIIFLLMLNRRSRMKRLQKQCKYFEEMDQKTPIGEKVPLDFPHKPLPDQQHVSGVETFVEFKTAFEEKITFDDAMELLRDDIKLYEVLGEGAFGLVRRGIYKDKVSGELEVAVKMLKDNPNAEDVKAFRQEIEVMKSVGRHKNIVSIIGHCTRMFNEMMLVTEYCSFGSLLDYLRNEWKFLHDMQVKQHITVTKATRPPQNAVLLPMATINESYGYPDHPDLCTNACKCDVLIKNIDASATRLECDQLEAALSESPKREACVEVRNCECESRKARVPLSVENKGYQQTEDVLPEEPPPTYENRELPKRVPLSYEDLIDIARQVAVGMEYLALNKVVHRDLAARNVLVTSDRTVKIADFGLSRDIYQENFYKKSGAGKLPIKWLALESITHQVYTTQSDVWSYGILLYEIATLGGNPYPAIPTNRLLRVLKAGYRMEKPKDCAPEFYDIMSSCWHLNPTNRPTFTAIIKSLDKLREDKPLSIPTKPLDKSISDASENYMKPF